MDKGKGRREPTPEAGTAQTPEPDTAQIPEPETTDNYMREIARRQEEELESLREDLRIASAVSISLALLLMRLHALWSCTAD